MATPANRITSANRYTVEIDGMPIISATQATLPEAKANTHQHQAGNETAARYGASTVEFSEFSFRHATAKGNVDRALLDWWRGFNMDGNDDKRNARVVVYAHNGRVPVRTYEMRNCCPTSFKPEEHAGNSTNTAEFSFSLQPEDFVIV